MHEIKSVT